MVETNFNYPIKCEGLLKESSRALREHLNLMGYSDSIVNLICNRTFELENPDYYFYYPELFKEAFNDINDTALKLLSLAGLFLYKSILHSDTILDNGSDNEKFNHFIIANICQDEGIKILSSFFPVKDKFWNLWTRRKMELVNGFEMERKPDRITNDSDYEDLADFKSSFGKIALDALHSLSGLKSFEDYQNIIKSHKFFFVAFQILDDIQDVEEDFKNGQYNMALEQIKKKYGLDKTGSIENLKKQLYLSGAANELYDKCLNYLKRAKEMLKKINLPLWLYEIQSLHNTVVSHKLNVNGFIVYSRTIASENNNRIKLSTVPDLLLNTESYINSKLKQNMFWNDYLNDAGLSDVWSTSYIVAVSSAEFLAHKQKIRTFIESNMYNDNFLWGYNTLWIPDADSTTFALLAMNKFKFKISREILSNWFNYQNKDGGFSTYNDENTLKASLNTRAINNVKGWISSHSCVSATAYYFLSLIGFNSEEFDRLREYILHMLSQESYGSYWWTKDYYALKYLIHGSNIINDVEINSKAKDMLLVEINKDSDFYSNEFYMAMVLESILDLMEKDKKTESLKRRIIKEITNNQFEDGSWGTNYSMRIPSPEIMTPKSEVSSWTKGTRGTNIILGDFNRLFTTAACSSAIRRYHEER